MMFIINEHGKWTCIKISLLIDIVVRKKLLISKTLNYFSSYFSKRNLCPGCNWRIEQICVWLFWRDLVIMISDNISYSLSSLSLSLSQFLSLMKILWLLKAKHEECVLAFEVNSAMKFKKFVFRSQVLYYQKEYGNGSTCKK